MKILVRHQLRLKCGNRRTPEYENEYICCLICSAASYMIKSHQAHSRKELKLQKLLTTAVIFPGMSTFRGSGKLSRNKNNNKLVEIKLK
jgi:hypothetical protein